MCIYKYIMYVCYKIHAHTHITIGKDDTMASDMGMTAGVVLQLLSQLEG